MDPSEYFLGLRLNTYVAAALTLGGAAWFVRTQRRHHLSTPGPTSDTMSGL